MLSPASRPLLTAPERIAMASASFMTQKFWSLLLDLVRERANKTLPDFHPSLEVGFTLSGRHVNKGHIVSLSSFRRFGQRVVEEPFTKVVASVVRRALYGPSTWISNEIRHE